MNLVEQYEKARAERGLTVAEFEAELGLPKYSVYPECRDLKSEAAIGYYMYDRAPQQPSSRKGYKQFSSEGVKPKSDKGLYGPTRLGGKQKDGGGFQWKKTRFYIGK